MSKYLNVDIARRAHIVTLYFTVFVLCIVTGGLWYGWQTAPQTLRVSITPELRAGGIAKPGEYQASTIYAFAIQTMRSLNRWEQNGVVDYGQRILDLQHRLTPTYREFLKRDIDIKNEKGELKDRIRYALEIPGTEQYKSEFVKPLPDGSWLVTVNMEIVERVASIEAKRVNISYPIRVVRMNIAPEKNLWGLALDGYPEKLRPSVLNSNDIASLR